MHSCYVVIMCTYILNVWMNWSDELLIFLRYNNFVEINGSIR